MTFIMRGLEGSDSRSEVAHTEYEPFTAGLSLNRLKEKAGRAILSGFIYLYDESVGKQSE